MARKTVIKATLTTVTEVLWRRARGMARACRRRDDSAVMPGGKSGLSPAVFLLRPKRWIWVGAGFLAAALTGTAHGATCTAVAGTNNWGTAATWTGCGGGVPGDGDNIIIPSGATVVLNVDSNRVNDLTINAGGVLRGDNTNKIFTLNKGAGVDVTNNGTIDFGQGNLARLFTRQTSQWTGAGTFNLSTIDLNNRVLTFAAGSTMTISMSGAATPFTGFLGTGSITSLAGMTWNFAGSVAQTLPATASAIFGNVTASNTAGVTLGIAFTAANLLGDLTVAANGILNNGAFAITLASGKSFSVAAGGRFNLTGTSTMVTVSGGGTKTFNATSTVDYAGANQAATAETYGNLIMSGSGTKTLAAGTTTVAGNYTLAAGVTYAGTTNNPVVNLAGNFSNSGTFNSGTGIFTFNGSTAQTLTGATTFTRLTMANTAAVANRKLTISNDVTVSTQLTFTTGRIVTGANEVIVPSGSTVSGAGSGTGWVAGRLQKFAAAGSPTVTFEVGTDGASAPALAYSPASLSFTGVGAGGGNLIAAANTGDHAQIASSGLDGAKSVNRWWLLTTTGVTGTTLPAFTNFSPTFTFVASDVDGGANTANFEIERWSGAAWNTTTVGTRTGTTTQATGVTALGEFAVAEKKPVVLVIGWFNAYETSTAAGAISGVIKTKIAGSAIGVDMIALNATKTAIATAFTGTVRVEVLNASDNSGALDADGCRPTWTTIQTLSPDPAFAAGDNGRKTISVTQANSYPNVRLRITYPAGAPTVTGCSNDNFAIRPSTFANFAVADTDWQTAGTGRALNLLTFAATIPTHKAGRPFSVRATAVNAAAATTTNYTGAPTAALSACAGVACTATFGNLTLNTTFAAGQLTSDVASYDNVGSFRAELVDSSFASVDAGDSSAAEREIRSAAIDVGRFVPDHFAVSLNTPVFGTFCGSFTYVGQAFNYTTVPEITVTAQDFANNTTTLYATSGSWWRITNASLTGKAYTAATGALDTSGLPGTDPVIFAAGGGMGTLTFGSGSGLFFTRTTPTAPASPYDADISLAINVIDADGVTLASNPVRFGTASAGNGIAFSSGKLMRFGRLAIRNANGSQLVPLPVQVEAQYWLGAPTNAFVTNTADSCTVIAANNDAMSNFTSNLSGSPTCETAISGGGALSAGRRTLQLAAPGSGNNGSVDITVNLGATASGTTCTILGAAPVAATTANLPYLQGNWSGGAYDQNPSARAAFGVYKGAEEVVHIRENF
jgi:G8 domain